MEAAGGSETTAELTFYVNGTKIVRRNPNPRMLLVEFLRSDLKLTGTKVACGEGGCGACTVLVSRYNRSTSTIRHYSTNACLTPICSLHGLAVTTVEALGSTSTKLHPIQERLVKSHGVQCGFCSPGMVMSMYALLRNNPHPTQCQIEHAIKGNLCRCTGYRPILDAFRSFAKDAPLCPMGDKCCKKTGAEPVADSDCGDGGKSSSCGSHDETQELIFPSELQLSDTLDSKSITFGSESDVLWLRPVSFDELLTLRKRYPASQLAAGCTIIAFGLKGTKPSVIIATTHVPELNVVQQTEDGVFIGAGITVTQCENQLQDLVQKLPGSKTRLVAALVDMFKVFASPQIRNTATVCGSLALASSSSDISVILMTSNSKVKLASNGGQREVLVRDFIKAKGQTSLQTDEVIVGVIVPFTTEDEYFGSFKQSPRRDLTIGDVNGAMHVEFEAGTDVIKSAQLAVGGIAAAGTQLIDVNKHLVGRKWDKNLLEAVLPGILSELASSGASSTDGVEIYRLASVQGFMFRFQLQVYDQLCQKLGLVALTESDQLYLEMLSQWKNRVHSGTQVYQVPEPASDTDKIGQPLPHQWSKQCTTGEAKFTDDARPAQGELYLGFVGSTKANARILSVDPSKALQMPGVVGYLDHKSIDPGSNMAGVYRSEELFTTEQVHWVGQTIGVVVADSHELARHAARAVEVKYEEAQPVITIEDAITQNSFHAFPPNEGHFIRGDTESALKSADHVLEGEVTLGGQEHFYMETHSCRAVPTGEDGEMDVYVGAQISSFQQGAVANALQVSSNKVTVHVKRMGGAFGGKELRLFVVTLPTALAAKKFNRPVRCMLDRHHDMQSTGIRRPNLAKYTIGFDKTGKLLALNMKLYGNEGFLLEFQNMFIGNTMLAIDNCYSIPNINIEAFMCKTNLPPNVAMRGAGSPQGVFLSEYVIHHVASFLGKSINEIQQLNLYKPGELSLGNVPIEASLHRCYQDVLKQGNFDGVRKEIDDFNRKSKYVKRGIDIVAVKFNPGLPRDWAQGGALIHIYVDGSVLISHAGVECGQGLHTKIIQVASRALDAPIELIHISETSSNLVPNGTATGGSSGSDIQGMAVMNACEILSERLKPYRAKNPSATWQQLILTAYCDRVCLSVAGYHKCPISDVYDWKTGTGRHGRYYTYGAAVTQVEIDCLTGNYTVLKVDIVMDVGKSLNPTIDIGQIEGAFVMGLGYHALEEHRFGPDGRLQTSGAGKYHIPSVSSVPLEMNVTLLKDSDNPVQAVYSSKGIGEPPLLLSTTVFFAIQDAISAARRDAGLAAEFHLDSPATVKKILLACTRP